MMMNRKLLIVLACIGSFSGLLNAQELKGEEGRPEFVVNFGNLPLEKREAYAVLQSKAQQFFRQKRTFESLDQIHQALEIFDEDPSMWNLKGSCHVEFRSFSKAKEAFRKGLALSPENTGILFNLAEMDFVTKDWKDCIDKMTTLTKRLEENAEGEMPEGTLNLHRLALFKIMLSHVKLGKLDEARELAEANWEIWDDTPFTYYSKAALAYAEEDDQEASRWIMTAVRVFGGLDQVANWQDTLIEFGYVKSFYGGEEGDKIDISTGR